MNILVCVKEVPDINKMKNDPANSMPILNSAPPILNPYDEYALNVAGKMKQSEPFTKVFALSMGTERAKVTLEGALAISAEKGYLVTGRQFGGSDTLATSYILSEAIKEIEKIEGKMDLIFCGRQAIDGDTGQVGTELAEYLGCPQVTCALEIAVEGDLVKILRETDRRLERIGVSMPCVVTFTIPSPNSCGLELTREKIRAQADISILTLKELPDINQDKIGLRNSPTRVVKSFAPQKGRNCFRIEEEDGRKAAQELFQLLSGAWII